MSFAVTATALLAVGAGVSAAGSIQAGNAASAAYGYQASVAANNAKIAQQNATYATLAGAQGAQTSGLKSAAQGGAIKTAFAANGVDVNSGSAVDVQSSERQIGNLNQQTDVTNSLLKAYGYQSQATGFKAQSGLDIAAAEEAPIAAAFSATSGLLKAGGTIYGAGAGSGDGGAGNNYALTADQLNPGGYGG